MKRTAAHLQARANGETPTTGMTRIDIHASRSGMTGIGIDATGRKTSNVVADAEMTTITAAEQAEGAVMCVTAAMAGTATRIDETTATEARIDTRLVGNARGTTTTTTTTTEAVAIVVETGGVQKGETAAHRSVEALHQKVPSLSASEPGPTPNGTSPHPASKAPALSPPKLQVFLAFQARLDSSGCRPSISASTVQVCRPV